MSDRETTGPCGATMCVSGCAAREHEGRECQAARDAAAHKTTPEAHGLNSTDLGYAAMILRRAADEMDPKASPHSVRSLNAAADFLFALGKEKVR